MTDTSNMTPSELEVYRIKDSMILSLQKRLVHASHDDTIAQLLGKFSIDNRFVLFATAVIRTTTNTATSRVIEIEAPEPSTIILGFQVFLTNSSNQVVGFLSAPNDLTSGSFVAFGTARTATSTSSSSAVTYTGISSCSVSYPDVSNRGLIQLSVSGNNLSTANASGSVLYIKRVL